MKRKQILTFLIVIVLVMVAAAAYSKRHSFFPSQQMKMLRQLESQLNLPKPKYRDENDTGYNKDFEGATHYGRHIALSYQDASVITKLRSELVTADWVEQPAKTIGSYAYFSFQKGNGTTMECVSGYTAPADSDGIVLNINLEAAGESDCSPTAGT